MERHRPGGQVAQQDRQDHERRPRSRSAPGRRSSRPRGRPGDLATPRPSAETASSSAPPASIAQPLSTTASRLRRSRLIATFPTAAPSGATPAPCAGREAKRPLAELQLSTNASDSPAIATAIPSRAAARSGSPAARAPASTARVERQHAEQHGREPRRDVLLAPVDEPVGGRERQQREHRREPRVGAQRPARRRAITEQPEPGEREADPRRRAAAGRPRGRS